MCFQQRSDVIRNPHYLFVVRCRLNNRRYMYAHRDPGLHQSFLSYVSDDGETWREHIVFFVCRVLDAFTSFFRR
jgi:hypothetical protein